MSRRWNRGPQGTTKLVEIIEKSVAGSSKTSNDEEEEDTIGDLEIDLAILDVALEEGIKDFSKTEADFRRKKEDHDVKVAAIKARKNKVQIQKDCLLYTSPSPRDS